MTDQSGARFPDAKVSLLNKSELVARGSTDNLGHYEIRLAAGDYVLRIEKLAFLPFEESISTTKCESGVERVAATLEGYGDLMITSEPNYVPLEPAQLPDHLVFQKQESPDPHRKRTKNHKARASHG